MLYIDQFVYTNKMRFFHPGEKLFFSLITMIICLLINNPFMHLTVIGVMIGLLVGKARIPGYVLGKILLVPLVFLLLGVITVALSWNNDGIGMLASVRIGDYFLGTTKEDLMSAGRIFLRALSSVTCLIFLAFTVPMIDMIYVLKLLKVPSLIIEMMLLIYRFIFVFVETAFHIYTAQSSRWGYSGFKRSVYSFGMLFANLWGKVYFKTRFLMESLLSRGYEGEIRVLYATPKFSGKNIFFFVTIDLALIVIALALPVY
jgi:cobalt/nickel transport system permease protein